MPASSPDFELTDETLARFDQALATIQEILAPFSGLGADDPERPLWEMHAAQEAFFRQTLLVLDENREALPPVYCLESVKWGLRTFDALRWRVLRLAEVAAEGDATIAQLADGLVDAALKGYLVLKLVGEPASVRRLQVLREALFQPAPASPPDAAAQD